MAVIKSLLILGRTNPQTKEFVQYSKLEADCRLLMLKRVVETAGPFIHQRSKGVDRLHNCFEKMQELARDSTSDIVSSHVRFQLQDAIDLRARNWAKKKDCTVSKAALPSPVSGNKEESKTDPKRVKEEGKQREAARKRKQIEQNYGKDLSASGKDLSASTLAHAYVSEFMGKFNNPVWHLSHDHQWRPSEYLVSEKADGQRCLVLCSCDGSVWCLRSRQKKQKVASPHVRIYIYIYIYGNKYMYICIWEHLMRCLLAC